MNTVLVVTAVAFQSHFYILAIAFFHQILTDSKCVEIQMNSLHIHLDRLPPKINTVRKWISIAISSIQVTSINSSRSLSIKIFCSFRLNPIEYFILKMVNVYMPTGDLVECFNSQINFFHVFWSRHFGTTAQPYEIEREIASDWLIRENANENSYKEKVSL